jgi:hypothetical protein
LSRGNWIFKLSPRSQTPRDPREGRPGFPVLRTPIYLRYLTLLLRERKF